MYFFDFLLKACASDKMHFSGDHDNSDSSDTDYDKKPTLGAMKIIMHAGYDPETVNNDVALLKLESKIKFSTFDGTVAPVCIPEEMTAYNGETVTVAGWGLQEENSNKITDKVGE